LFGEYLENSEKLHSSDLFTIGPTCSKTHHPHFIITAITTKLLIPFEKRFVIGNIPSRPPFALDVGSCVNNNAISSNAVSLM
jgi:hypothetical protein